MLNRLEFYRRPLTRAHAALFDALPDDAEALAQTVPGLLIHQHIAPVYGETLGPARALEAQLRPVDDVLACVLEHDSAPLSQARPAPARTVGNCRHFSLLFAAMLRHKAIPARARCGFGAYFEKGKFLDHWVTELWNGTRWRRIDAQLDDVQKTLFRIDFDTMDVPRDRFLTAGDAWTLCREGKADPDAFGIMDLHGWWFVAGNIVRDIASLNDHVMLPWDVWGAMPKAGETPDFARFDRWAALTRDPDTHFDELRELYMSDDLKVPPVVFNAMTQRMEKV